MDLSTEEVGPTEDTILALLDFLVDPLLPSKSISSRKDLSPFQEELVAKQVHAVVLLYNYYHRKRYQGLDFLDFESFCKMAVSLKPSLLSYLRLMQKADHTQVDDSDKEHSLTEKAIMNACEICKMLDASNNNPSMDGWPITKVAVFLVDDKKENCYLFHSSITQGVWSVIEKNVNAPSQSSEAVIQSRSGDKKKRVIKRAPKENQSANETSLQQLAYAAVKEACGINQSDLKVLENHVVYSISKEKTAVRFYIMQCTLTNQDMNLVPMNDAMESLQGPLVRKEAVSWITTPVVEYFHLLPFADKVSDWLSREGLLNISLNSEVRMEAGICNSSQLNVELQPNISNSFEAINAVEDHNSQLKEEPLVNNSQPVEVAMEVEDNDNSNPSNHFEAINGIEDHNSQLKEEPLVNISQPVEVAMEVEHNDISNPSNHFEAINGVEDHTFQLKEEPLMSITQPVEVAMEVEQNDSSNRKEEQLENIPEPLSVEKEVRNRSCSLKDEPCELKDEPLSNSPQHTETTNEVEENNSSLLIEGPLMDTSQPSVVEELRNDNCQLKEEHSLYNSPHSETTKEVEDDKISRRKEKPSETVVYTKRKRSQTHCSSNKSLSSKKSNAAPENSGLRDKVTVSSNNTDIDEAVMTCLQANGESKSIPCEDHNENQKQLVLVEGTDPIAMTRDANYVGEVNDSLPISQEHNAKGVSSDNKISGTAMSFPDEKQFHALVSFDSNLEHLQKVQQTIASKDTSLSETALKVLFKKRERLSQQHRSIADDIALCERSIQTILNGGEDDLAVKLDALIEGCNSECLRIAHQAEDSTDLQIINLDLPPVKKRKTLSEASLCVYSPCQELDGICDANRWTLPTYNFSASEGGFQASVTLKGPDFECSSEGTPCSTPLEARNLAASKLLAKLRSMASKS